ncbi:MAG: hypothetical protein U5R48_06500 [Gammaproteobacteria bacterium]|nr:hypothetical protein [Gammaproteobacteria bacterium]
MEAEPAAPAVAGRAPERAGRWRPVRREDWMMIGAAGGGRAGGARRGGPDADPAARRRSSRRGVRAPNVEAGTLRARTQLMPAISSEELGDTAGEDGAGGGEDDAIGEADVYMVYGRFSEAARVLSSAIEADPRQVGHPALDLPRGLCRVR